MGAYYAGLPLDTPAASIMVGPPLFCHLNDTLDELPWTACGPTNRPLYVQEGAAPQAVGVLAYPDIVGLLYRYCHRCDKNLRRNTEDSEPLPADRVHLREVMTPGVFALEVGASLLQVMEGLAAHKFGALLIHREDAQRDLQDRPHRRLPTPHPPEAPARTVMTPGVQACDGNDVLVNALRRMIFADISRLFVYRGIPAHRRRVLPVRCHPFPLGNLPGLRQQPHSPPLNPFETSA